MSNITNITQQSQLDGILTSAGERVVVVDFTASWCGPCKAIAPHFERMSTEYRQVVFTKCDVDAAKPVAQKYRIVRMFLFRRWINAATNVRSSIVRNAQLRLHQEWSGA